MRRIDLQPDITRVKMPVCCTDVHVWVGGPGQSVPIHEMGGAISVTQRRIVSVAWQNLFIAPRPSEEPQRVAINTTQRIDDRYRPRSV